MTVAGVSSQALGIEPNTLSSSAKIEKRMFHTLRLLKRLISRSLRTYTSETSTVSKPSLQGQKPNLQGLFDDLQGFISTILVSLERR
jgi:hypothetical protein